MNKRFMPLLLALILLLSLSCAACKAGKDPLPESTVASNVPEVSVATEPSESESHWNMGEVPWDGEELETEPVIQTETEPAETKPTETKPTETKPTGNEPAETKPAETKPAETKPAETKPTETESPATEPTELDWGMGEVEF